MMLRKIFALRIIFHSVHCFQIDCQSTGFLPGRFEQGLAKNTSRTPSIAVPAGAGLMRRWRAINQGAQ